MITVTRKLSGVFIAFFVRRSAGKTFTTSGEQQQL
jgi:hypothetical protein